jgi:hypothetical protein
LQFSQREHSIWRAGQKRKEAGSVMLSVSPSKV